MSHYSNVVLVFPKTTLEEFRKRIHSLEDENVKTSVIGCLNNTFFEQCENSVLYEWQTIRWWDKYEDISFIMGFLDWIDSQDDTEHDYKFFRITENDEEIIERGDYVDESMELELSSWIGDPVKRRAYWEQKQTNK